jgi:putative inorganic carbon (HCO3(-)) transporter
MSEEIIMLHWIFFFITILVLAFLMLRKPVGLIPLLVIAVALEISSAWYPELGTVGKILSPLSLTRFTSLALIGALILRFSLYREIRIKCFTILKDPLTLVLLLYLALGAVSLSYSAAPRETAIEVLRLVVLFGVFLAIATLVDRKQVLYPFKALLGMALVLAPFAFYEVARGKLLWLQATEVGRGIIRAKVTFIDPNILARYLILGIIAAFILQYYTREKGKRYFYFGAQIVLLVELFLTNSRGGFITLAIVLLAVLIILPRRRRALAILGICVLGCALVLLLRPEMMERMLSLTQGLEASNPQRFYLWQAALAIFKDHIVLGTGLGTFQTVFLTDYIHLKTVADGATLSHTTVLTIASELGILGLGVLALIWGVLLAKLLVLFRTGNDYLGMFNDSRNAYLAGAGYFLWILAIFISSQGEGRFFEDPLFWLSSACLLALKLRSETLSLN